MSLNFEIDSIDNVDESIRGLYKEDNGRFILDVDLGDKYVPAESVAGLKANHDQLLSEKKKAKEEAARVAEEKAKASGDLESLQKYAQQRESELQEKLNSLQKSIANKELNSTASNIAHDLADGANAKLLSKLIKDRLRYEDGEMKVLDDDGNLTMSSIEELKKEIQTSSDYSSLVRGSKATGSGALGGTDGGASKETMTRAEWDVLGEKEKREFFKSGGKLV